ncbi:MAG: recombinase family protein, partial [Candidatus Microthrix parvicella]
MLTIAYVRVSTDDQVEHSPDAQRRRCAEYAAQKNLGPVKFLSDEGQSGKDLERPAMQELVGLIEADQVTNLIVWRMDRLSRDSGDTSRLLRLFEQHCVNVHSLNEGDLETGSASGRFTAGLHGLLAQLEREKIIENIHLGNEQAVRTGYWINRAPTGYNAVDRVLVPNDDAHLIRRAFKLRAGGQSYPQIEQGTGLKYSTVRHALE